MSDVSQIVLFKKTIHYLSRYRMLSFLVIILSFCASVLESFSIVSIVPIIQSTLSHGGEALSVLPRINFIWNYFVYLDPQIVLIQLLVFVFVVVVIKNIFIYYTAITSNKISNYLRRDLQNDLFVAIVGARVQFFDTLRLGHLVGSISVYTESIAGYIFSFLNLSSQLIRLGTYVILLLVISFKLTFAAFLILVFLIPMTQIILNSIQKIGFITAHTVSDLHSQMIEMFGNVRLMKLFATEQYEQGRFSVTVEKLKDNYIHTAIFSNLFRPSAEILLGLVLIGLVLISTFYFHLTLADRLPFIVVYFYLFIQAFTQLISFNTLLGKLSQNYESFVAYEELLINAEKNTSAPPKKLIPVLFKKNISFNNVFFSYLPEKKVLNGLTLNIPYGSFIALVGPTGSGKSTVVNLVAGLYSPQEGEILVDGQNLSDFSSSIWLGKIGFVSQENILFNDTIRNNITYGLTGITNDQVIFATQVARLHEYIASLPQEYNTVIGERGVQLSGGQKQRLAIARSIIRQPEILIFDEATSSLDNETELIVQENLKKLTQGKTVIAIAHRLSTIQQADTIFFIDKGRVVEQGSHKELLLRNGYYSHFYYLQFNRG